MNELLLNEEQYVKVSNFLAAVNASKNLQMPVARLKPTPSELYVNSKFAAGGVANLLTSNAVQEVGVTNFDGNKLEADRYFVADAVTVQYGEGNSSDPVYNIKYNVELPPVLLASHLVIRQKNEIIVKLPISAIENAKKSDAYYRKLEALALIEPNAPVEIQIETPMGSKITPSSGDTSFARVLLKGFETYQKR
ncbi:hypothetical protein [Capnocytophaga felis]|uniref:Uncharacterized protein n=1 Tax=Capnocytophaga felis TaxID=2267611 RepID=A0A5M4BC32_9FLAO|nr:hypothetical protein [Capnocytophaga felis]GET46912.1 hypothetical protein RCZ01_22140 [Capnocytophaga felis]GET49432.1 hypothetical protein RCZ02_22630 [Capnocytophaga felis]